MLLSCWPWGGIGTGCVDVQVSSDDADADGDGYDNIAEGGTDCNDSDPEIHPDAEEICDQVDNDCDQYVDCDDEDVADLDEDGACTCDDCDDLDPDNYPGKAEICDGADNDCDGVADNGLSFSDWYADVDGDGHGDPDSLTSTCDGPPDADWLEVGDDCDDLDPDNYPGNDEVCDGGDNDCDGLAVCLDGDSTDADGDGTCACEDCDDADPDNYPGNTEVCDGGDNDCDGLVDCADSDIPDADGDGYCECVDCDDNDPGLGQGDTEICDGLDNDCDGEVDEDFWGMNIGALVCSVDPASPSCNDPAVAIANSVIDVDMSSLSGITFALYMDNAADYTWDVGDSPSNDCCCGDSSDRSHDGEVWVSGGNDLGVCSQDGYAWTDFLNDAYTVNGAAWIEVSVSASFLRVVGDGFCLEYSEGIFPLTGYDNEYGNNDDEMIHVGMNKVIQAGSSRTGSGLTLVELYYWP